jgi:hypothetical protein
MGLVASISFGVALVAGVSGLVLLLTAPKSTDAPRARRVTPVLGAGYLGLRGAF